MRPSSRSGIYRRFGKRLLDVVGASLALLIVLPIMGVIALVIRIRMGAPVCYSERRAGRNARPFVLWKFRTMTNDRDDRGQLLQDHERLTPLGRFLRRTSVDELPEFWHVLRGDMSLVGPRPLPVRYLERYSEGQARRLDVTPGITGLVQVRGRNGLTWDQKFALDVWYVDHQSLWMDLELLFLTVATVLRGDGVSQPGHATMEEFLGSIADAPPDLSPMKIRGSDG
ncbi:MAG: sugar transferase [Vicinamibacterales bacterium]